MAARDLVRPMLIVGSAQAISILIGVVRLKVLALLLGPAGVGLLGLYNALLHFASALAGLGIGSSGVRRIAATGGDPVALSCVRSVMLCASLVQGLAAFLLLWALREPLAHLILSDPDRTAEITLIGLAVILTLLAGSQTAVLQGCRKVDQLARVTVASGLGGTGIGLLVIWFRGEDGLIWLAAALPLCTAVAAFAFTRRLPLERARRSLAAMWIEWHGMAGLGLAFMVSSLLGIGTLLAVRAIITRELGLDATGQFQAAWTISFQYIGFLLGAMGADFYPRLTETITNRTASNRLVNDQILLGAAVGGPILLATIGLAPWIVTALYSHGFDEAAGLLQWQAVGNVLKVTSWPIAFILVAGSRAWAFFAVELVANALMVVPVWFGLSTFGLEITGLAMLACYAVYILVTSAVTRRLHGFRWEKQALALTAAHALTAFLLVLLAQVEPVAAAIAGVAAASVSGIIGLRIVIGTTVFRKLRNKLSRFAAEPLGERHAD